MYIDNSYDFLAMQNMLKEVHHIFTCLVANEAVVSDAKENV